MTRLRLDMKKERVILSDVLPYELPVIFSNRFFYNFLVKYNVRLVDDKIVWNDSSQVVDKIILLLFSPQKTDAISSICNSATGIKEKCVCINYKKDDKNNVKIPFQYRIKHKENRYRELTLIHPFNQLQMVNFYDTYSNFILYCCGKSEFSIRRPTRLSKYVFYKDKLHSDVLSDEEIGIEQFDNEYEKLKSFFVYKNYSNIHKFYESYLFHRCEKKYNNLLKLDISKCFDSVYTHSLAWAIYGKSFVKSKINEVGSSFAGKFDRLMENLNYQETNGIVIGPEFSRIFAEIILQDVDNQLLKALNIKGLKHKCDYEIYRYVDDYFIFYNTCIHKDLIVNELQVLLRNYNLYLNTEKENIYSKPIITEISIAKSKIERLFNKNLKYEKEKTEDGWDGSIKINSQDLITKFKTILKESGAEYKDILNYSLALVENKIKMMFKDYKIIMQNRNVEKNLVNSLSNLLEFVFFIYSVAPRVNSTIRLCRILHQVTHFLRRKGANKDLKDAIFQQIYDNIRFILNKNCVEDYSQVETVYLLICLSDLDKRFLLDEDKLAEYFCLSKNDDGEDTSKFELNYICITALLFYIRNKKRYATLKTYIEESVWHKFYKRKKYIGKDTELTLLLFDIIACPYVCIRLKRALLLLFGIKGGHLQNAVMNYNKFWFIKWKDFNLGKELNAKKGQEVY